MKFKIGDRIELTTCLGIVICMMIVDINIQNKKYVVQWDYDGKSISRSLDFSQVEKNGVLWSKDVWKDFKDRIDERIIS